MKKSDLQRPRLLIVSDYGWLGGGVERVVHEFLRRAQQEFTCALFTWHAEPLVPGGFENIGYPVNGDVRGLWDQLDASDIVLIHTSFNVRMLARIAADYLARTPKPSMVVVHTSDHTSQAASSKAVQLEWLDSLVASSEVTVAVSDDVASAIRSKCDPSSASARIEIIENAARLARHHGGPRDRRRKTVSFIGRPAPTKGLDLFERLAGEFSPKGLRFLANTVSLVSPNPSPHITYTHLLTDAQLLDFFEQSDLLLVPYLRAEGWPLAVLEALNCGVPAIGFDTPGLGAMLRRFGQTAIEPSYPALRDALIRWHSGNLEPVAPTPGMVESWDTKCARYIDLLRQLLQTVEAPNSSTQSI